MATFSKIPLSASSDGMGILVVATASPGTTVHTGSSSTSTIDEMWLYCANPDGSSHVVTVQFGGTTSPDNSITATVPAYSGLALLVPGLILRGNATPLVVRAFADVASKVSIVGFVNRIS